MLLKRLVEFANRPSSELPPEYYRPKKIQWILRLGDDGRVELWDQRPAKGSKDKPLEAVVPYAYRSGVKPPPYLLVDTAQYVLAVPKTGPDGTTSQEAVAEAARRRRAWLELAFDWARSVPDESAARALLKCLESRHITQLEIPETMSPGDNVALMTDDGTWLHALPSVQARWAQLVRERKGDGKLPGLCLVCGEQGELLSTIPESIKAGAIPTSGLGKDAQLVSINAPAQGRGGVIQLANTPVCEPCGSRAMAALNVLLADVDQRRRGGESVTVWWTREPADSIMTLLDEPTADDVLRLFDSLQVRPDLVSTESVDANEYYSLTLAVNNARVVLLDWLDVPLRDVCENVAAWFRDHRVFDGWTGEYRYLPVWLLALAPGRWDEKTKYLPRSAPRGLEAKLVRAALTRAPLPPSLLPHLLQRIRADQHLDFSRVALIRLLLNPTRMEDTRPMDHLDPDKADIGYLCGRAFAVLESVQHAALREVNTTISDQFLGTAMTAPGSVLHNLRVRANAHLKRLRRDNPAAHHALSARLSEAYAAFAARPGGIPPLLTVRQQGWFVLGYEHQRAQDGAARAAAKARKEASAAAQAETEDVPAAL